MKPLLTTGAVFILIGFLLLGLSTLSVIQSTGTGEQTEGISFIKNLPKEITISRDVLVGSLAFVLIILISGVLVMEKRII